MNPTLNMLDQLLQRAAPAVPVPVYEDLRPLSEPGHRYLISRTGLHMEVCRPWLHCITPPFQRLDGVKLPYGPITPCVTFNFEQWVIKDMIWRFVERAKQQAPRECGAWITWFPGGTLLLQHTRAITASAHDLEYERPVLHDGEVLLCDLHSHGHHPAGFSPKDDQDDFGEVKLAGVVGSLNAEEASVCMRLCLPGGLFIHADDPDLGLDVDLMP